MQGAEIIVNLLKLHGITSVFGYPGAYVLDIYDAIRNNGIENVLTVTEHGAICAADGYARITHNLGVVIATSGPGASNLTTGLACAQLDGTPLLAITGNVPTTYLGTDSFQEVDIIGITMPITKYGRMVKSIDELPSAVNDAIRIALDGRRGAVILDIPQDVQQAESNVTLKELCVLITNNENTNIINRDFQEVFDQIADSINQSERVILLVGGGVRIADAIDDATGLASKLNCPIVTTLMGVACVDNTLPAYFGMTGAYGNPTANHCLNTTDIILSLGVRFNDRLRSHQNWNNKRIIQIDIDEAENDKTVSAEIYIKCDLKYAIRELYRRINPKSNRYIETLKNYRRKIGKGDNNRHMRNILNAIRPYTDNAIITTDVGEHQMAVAKNYIFGKNFLTNGGLGAMGWGLGALIGAIIAQKQQKSGVKGFLLTGDGSFSMEFNELATAVALDLPIIVIVFNNNSLEMCRAVQFKRFEYEYNTHPNCNIDFAALAISMGAHGKCADNLQRLIKILNEYESDKPLVIDLRIN